MCADTGEAFHFSSVCSLQFSTDLNNVPGKQLTDSCNYIINTTHTQAASAITHNTQYSIGNTAKCRQLRLPIDEQDRTERGVEDNESFSSISKESRD